MYYVIKSKNGYLLRGSVVPNKIKGCVYSATFGSNIYSASRFESKKAAKTLCKLINTVTKDKCWVMSVGELDGYLWIE